MEPLDLPAVEEYVNENIGAFHEGRLDSLKNLDMNRLLRKNPYLFRAKNILTASEMVEGFMDAFLSSSEEERFGQFLEGLAIFVAEQTSGGHKSTAPGVDLEFMNRGVHYVVSIKSGPNWGNASQQNQLEENLKTAVRRVKQGDMRANVQSVLGICYGRTRTGFLRGYLKVVGQNFWYFISENKDLYTEIIDPIGYRAKEHNQQYMARKAEAANRITRDFVDEYCHSSGAIDWPKLVKVSCGNYDLDKFMSSVDLE